jgi:hypothetical protein
MRSVSQSFNLFTNALGSWITIPLTLLVNVNQNSPWIPDNVDDGKLDYYYFLLAGIMTLAYIIFVYVSQSFIYADPEELERMDRITNRDNIVLESEESLNALLVNEKVGRNSMPNQSNISKSHKNNHLDESEL